MSLFYHSSLIPENKLEKKCNSSSWNEANETCSAEGGKLVEDVNKTKLQGFKECPEQQGFWIALRREWKVIKGDHHQMYEGNWKKSVGLSSCPEFW